MNYHLQINTFTVVIQLRHFSFRPFCHVKVKNFMMTHRFTSPQKDKLQTACDPSRSIFFQTRATDYYVSNHILIGLFIKENLIRL